MGKPLSVAGALVCLLQPALALVCVLHPAPSLGHSCPPAVGAELTGTHSRPLVHTLVCAQWRSRKVRHHRGSFAGRLQVLKLWPRAKENVTARDSG